MSTVVIVDACSHHGAGGITYLANVLPLLAEQPEIDSVVAVVERPAALDDRLRGTPVRIEVRPGRSGVASRVWWESTGLAQLARARDAVVLAPSAILPRRLPAPVVAVPQNVLPFQSTDATNRLRRGAITRTLNSAAGVIFPSQQMRDTVRTRTQRPALERVIPHGLAAPFRAPVPPQNRRTAIVTIADWHPHKRLALAIEAWARLGSDRPALRVIGASAASAPPGTPTDGVRFEPDLPASAVADALREALLVVLTSEAESFGLPVLESLACEAPLVMNDLPVFRELSAGHGQLVASSRPEDWTRAMRSALEKPGPTSPAAGREHALTFTWQAAAAATAALLLEAQRTDDTAIRPRPLRGATLRA